MTTKIQNKTPWETKLIEKIYDVINYSFPKIEKKALDQFKRENAKEISLIKTNRDFYRGFQAWFLLEYLIEDKFTPMEFILGNPASYFNKSELKMITNFLDDKKGWYELVHISKNNKDFTIKNIINSKIIIVKTIDFPAKLKKGEYIYARPVQKLKGGYFFYGNLFCYSKEEGENIKMALLIELKHLKDLDEENTLKKEELNEYDIKIKVADNPEDGKVDIKRIRK